MNAITETIASHKNVYVALAAAQQDMGPLFKGTTNPHFKKQYANSNNKCSRNHPNRLEPKAYLMRFPQLPPKQVLNYSGMNTQTKSGHSRKKRRITSPIYLMRRKLNWFKKTHSWRQQNEQYSTNWSQHPTYPI